MSYGISIDLEPDPGIDLRNDAETTAHLRELADRVRPVVDHTTATVDVVHRPSTRPDVAPPDAYVRVDIPQAGNNIGQTLRDAAELAETLDAAGFAINNVHVVDWQYIVALA